jgi:prolyl-tRNA synthetase
MKQSRLFSKTRKEAPADEVSKNAQLLIRAGYIYKEMAGVYTLLPLGLRTVAKIAQIIRDEMNGLGAFEMQSSALQTKEVWEKTRWSDEVVDNWFKTKLKNDTELGLAFTHEEPLTAMMRNYLSSYKDLPAYVYDIKTVFRNEARAKSGLMRGREFFWKALYSFSKNKEEHDVFYEKITQSYLRIFNKVGLGDTTYLTFASGGSFAKYSHEFQTICDAGEDTIYVHEGRRLAVNKEVYIDEVLQDIDLNPADLVEQKAVEVGNIFSLGSKFSEPLELKVTNEQGEQETVFMGSYGIGITRLLGVIAENLSDEKGLVLPESIAPFKLHLLVFGSNDALVREANELYQDLIQAEIEVLYDDRENLSPGEKLRDADLLGVPYRLVLSEKSQQNGGVEITNRLTGKTEYLDIPRITHHFSEKK